MIKAQANRVVNVPAEQLFQFIAVDFFDNYQLWSPEVIVLQRLSEGPVGLGTIARQVRVDQGRQNESTFEVCAFDKGKRVGFRDTSNAFTVSYSMQEMQGSTNLEFQFGLTRVEFFMRPFEKLIRIAIEDGANQVVTRIKRLIEAKARSDSNE